MRPFPGCTKMNDYEWDKFLDATKRGGYGWGFFWLQLKGMNMDGVRFLFVTKRDDYGWGHFPITTKRDNYEGSCFWLLLYEGI